MFRKMFVGIALAAALAPAVALAASDNQAAPGTPGEKNCKGQTTAYLAQWAQNYDIPIAPGLASVIDTYYGGDKAVKDAVVAAYCA